MKIFLYLLGLVIILSAIFFIKKSFRKALPIEFIGYQNLYENSHESENYELVKIFDHYSGERMIDGINYFRKAHKDTISNNTIITYNLVEYSMHRDIWMENGPCYGFLKIDGNGNKIDSISVGNNIANNCGVFFFQDNYIDWIITGEKNKKSYSEIIDGDLLTDTEFDNILSTTSEIYIDKDYDNDKALIYLKNNLGWALLKSRKHYDKLVSADGLLNNWILKPYNSKTKNRFIEIPYYNSRADKDITHQNFLVTEHFMKTQKHKSSLGDFNNTRRVGWSGTGYFKLNYNSEIINFKASAFNNSLDKSSIYFTNNKTQDFVLIQLDKKAADDRDFKESGTYVLRKK